MRAKMPLLLLALASLVMTGCLRADVDIVVNDDGTASMSVLYAADPGAVPQMMVDSGLATAADVEELSRDDICFEVATIADGAPPEVTVEGYDQDGFCGVQWTFDFETGPDVLDNLPQFGDAMDGDQGLVLEQRNGQWLFELEVPPPNDDMTAEEFAALSPYLAGSDITYRVELPGTPLEGGNNADEVNGSVFTWKYDAVDDERVILFARTAAPGVELEQGSVSDNEPAAESDRGSRAESSDDPETGDPETSDPETSDPETSDAETSDDTEEPRRPEVATDDTEASGEPPASDAADGDASDGEVAATEQIESTPPAEDSMTEDAAGEAQSSDAAETVASDDVVEVQPLPDDSTSDTAQPAPSQAAFVDPEDNKGSLPLMAGALGILGAAGAVFIYRRNKGGAPAGAVSTPSTPATEPPATLFEALESSPVAGTALDTTATPDSAAPSEPLFEVVPLNDLETEAVPPTPMPATPMPTAPTTPMPTTPMPTAPTTAMPTTQMPTTQMPAAPTTPIPTTAMPTTAMPTTPTPTEKPSLATKGEGLLTQRMRMLKDSAQGVDEPSLPAGPAPATAQVVAPPIPKSHTAPAATVPDTTPPAASTTTASTTTMPPEPQAASTLPPPPAQTTTTDTTTPDPATALLPPPPAQTTTTDTTTPDPATATATTLPPPVDDSASTEAESQRTSELVEATDLDDGEPATPPVGALSTEAGRVATPTAIPTGPTIEGVHQLGTDLGEDDDLLDNQPITVIPDAATTTKVPTPNGTAETADNKTLEPPDTDTKSTDTADTKTLEPPDTDNKSTDTTDAKSTDAADDSSSTSDSSGQPAEKVARWDDALDTWVAWDDEHGLIMFDQKSGDWLVV